MTPLERRELITKFLALGYQALTPTERMIIAYTVTPGGCHACPRPTSVNA
jgi:hypothetical protein